MYFYVLSMLKVKDKVLPSARLETGEAVDKSDILEKFKSVRDSHSDEVFGGSRLSGRCTSSSRWARPAMAPDV